MKITVASYNVLHFENFLTKKIDFDTFAQTIKELNADIIGLNEVRGEGPMSGYTAQAKTIAEMLGYHYYFAKAIDVAGCNPYGNAILSKFPIKDAKTVIVPDPKIKKYNGSYETRCLLKAKIEICGGVDILVSHFGLNPDEQENCVNTVCENISERTILMGDFNVTPDNAVLLPIKNIMNDTADDNKQMLSFPSDEPKIKIDYIFTTKNICKISSNVIPVIVSDHRPYVAVLEI